MHKSTVCTCVLLALFLGGNAVRGENANAKKESPLEGAVYIKSQEAVSEVPVEEIEYHLAWAKTPLRADGDLAKWQKLGVKPVRLAGGKHVSWLSGAYHGDADLSADVYLARDFDNLYIGVQVADDEPAPAVLGGGGRQGSGLVVHVEQSGEAVQHRTVGG